MWRVFFDYSKGNLCFDETGLESGISGQRGFWLFGNPFKEGRVDDSLKTDAGRSADVTGLTRLQEADQRQIPNKALVEADGEAQLMKLMEAVEQVVAGEETPSENLVLLYMFFFFMFFHVHLI